MSTASAQQGPKSPPAWQRANGLPPQGKGPHLHERITLSHGQWWSSFTFVLNLHQSAICAACIRASLCDKATFTGR